MSYRLSPSEFLIHFDNFSRADIIPHLGSGATTYDGVSNANTNDSVVPLISHAFTPYVSHRYHATAALPLASENHIELATALMPPGGKLPLSRLPMITEIQGYCDLGAGSAVGMTIMPFYAYLQAGGDSPFALPPGDEWGLATTQNYFQIPASSVNGSHNGDRTLTFKQRIAYVPEDTYLVFGFRITNHNSGAKQIRPAVSLYGFRWESDFVYYDPNMG